MSAGTLTLTNNSAAVAGNGTAFTTEVAAGDFIVVTVGGVPYTLPIKSVESGTALTLVSNFTGPTQAGAAWSAVPRMALNMVTAAMVVQNTEALRGLNYDKQNWQSIFSGTGTATVRLPDGSSFTGPAWGGIATTLDGKAGKGANSDITSLSGLTTPLSMGQGGLGATDATGGRSALGLKSAATAEITTSDTDTTVGRVLKVGDFGLGKRINPKIDDVYNKKYSTGVYKLDTGTGGWPYPYAMMIRMSDRDYGAGGDAYRQQAFAAIAVGAGNHGMRFIFYADGGAETWQTVYGTNNTTVDGNGFIKTASPVIKIFANGACECMPEAEGCCVKHIATGEYLITGCVGLNSDAAWGGIDGGFEIPVDRNKNPRIWLDYKVNADGSVLIRTYHRVHSSAPEFARNRIGNTDINGVFTEAVADGEPVDIPADSFVSVRVEMPEDSIWNEAQKEALEAMEKAGRERQQKALEAMEKAERERQQNQQDA
ncbi:phage tail protein [Citrobacter portucalensis]|uniref:phage tail fiber protein n=1 Tax=Citrobacter freundii complex TaxID=1344959 RepID=UPI0029DBE876|nr:phage tail protein [Citrobacter freundii]MDX6984154.1 phage tail protein [Citrobacter freundii]